MINVIGKKYIFITIAGLLMVAGIAAIGIFGLKTGVDFAGGVSWQLHFKNLPTVEQLAPVFAADAVITPQSGDNFLIRLKEITEDQRKVYFQKLTKSFGQVEELQF